MALTVRACAKLNLTLDIVGKRQDGYHSLNMIIQSIDLADKLSFSLRNDNKIFVTSTNTSLGGENDISYKAAKYFLAETGKNIGVDIHIEKNIPLSSGLGGGSSDAAAVLLALNTLFGNLLSVEKLEKISINLGADVPYFLHGGAAFVSGVGEKIEKLPTMPDCFIVVSKCGEKKSTKDMYQIIDLYDDLPKIDNNSAISALTSGDLNSLCKYIENDFSHAWDIDFIKNIILKFSPKAVSLSGSGPSVFSIFDNEKDAFLCKNELKNNNFTAFITRPTQKAIHFD